MKTMTAGSNGAARAVGLIVSGARDTAPILLGIAPFGAIAGISTAAAGIDTGAALGLSIGVFAGASHLVAVDLMDRGAAPIVIILAALVVNLRYLMYSAGLAPHFSHLPRIWKGGLSYITTDQSFAIATDWYRGHLGVTGKRWYYLGSAIAVWLTFQVTFLFGFSLGVSIPTSLSPEFAIPLTFIALLIRAISDRATAVAAVCGGLCSLLLVGLPYQLGLLGAGAVGLGGGLAAESRWSK